jgi:hypothetical protein
MANKLEPKTRYAILEPISGTYWTANLLHLRQGRAGKIDPSLLEWQPRFTAEPTKTWARSLTAARQIVRYEIVRSVRPSLPQLEIEMFEQAYRSVGQSPLDIDLPSRTFAKLFCHHGEDVATAYTKLNLHLHPDYVFMVRFGYADHRISAKTLKMHVPTALVHESKGFVTEDDLVMIKMLTGAQKWVDLRPCLP